MIDVTREGERMIDVTHDGAAERACLQCLLVNKRRESKQNHT